MVVFSRVTPAIKGLILLLLCIWHSHARAQLLVDTTRTPEELVKGVFAGACVNIQNVKFTGAARAISYFNGRQTNIGIDEGILLTTGSVFTANGPNLDSGMSNMNFTPGDTQLTKLIHSRATYDAAVLEFDFQSDNDTVYFRYVFASEEFSEYVGKNYNDLFAFYVSGPGISGYRNVAMLPGSNIAVTINNVNHKVNSQYYVNNQSGKSIEFDGFTVVLEAKVPVQPCMLYHMKLAVADAGDFAYDSGVFLEARSFGGKRVQVVRRQNATEGCTDGLFSFVRPGNLDQPLKVKFNISGKAISGKDYKAIDSFIIIPKGEKSVDLYIKTFVDTLIEGAETVVIRVKDDCLCTGSSSDSIYIFDNPFPSSLLATHKLKLCRGDSVKLSASYPGVKFKWSPPDGLSCDSLKDPYAFPSSSSMYKLTVWNEEGCSASDSVLVAVFESPVAGFQAGPSCLNTLYHFNDLSSGNIESYKWDFGDGFGSAEHSPDHKFKLPGAYDVTLTVATDKGCSHTVTRRISILPSPVANFKIPELCERQPAVIVNNASISWGKVKRYYWEFGNGKTSADPNPRVQYDTAGEYLIRLVVTSEGGCTDTIKKMVVVKKMLKTNFFFRTYCNDTSAAFWAISAKGKNDDDIIRSYKWDFGDGTFAMEQNPVHKYNTPGKYMVKLISANANGCTDTVVKSFTVYGKPKALFSWNISCADSEIVFLNESKLSVVEQADYFWSFGDGTYSLLRDPVHSYPDPGVYYVKLVVTNKAGCSDSVTMKVAINPKPDLSFSVDQQCSDPAINFYVHTASSENISSWNWEFGDGTTSYLKEPQHIYTIAGAYTARLTATTSMGCKLQLSATVIVKTPLRADFEELQACDGLSVSFKNTSSLPGALKYCRWDFGDGNTSDLPHPSHTYTHTGQFNVILHIETAEGCTSSHTKAVQMNGKLQPVILTKGGCIHDSGWAFTGGVISNKADIAEWYWDFGDGSHAVGKEVNHTYALPDSYNVLLKVTTLGGCSYEEHKIVEQAPQPKIAIKIPESLCAGEDGLFSLEGDGLPQNIIATWHFGDGEQKGGITTTHIFRTAGTYNVILRCVYDGHCNFSVQKKLTIIQPPVFRPLTITPACAGNAVYFRADMEKGSLPTDIVWDFGDGNFGNGREVWHTYATAGEYEVALSAAAGSACSGSLRTRVVVYARPKAKMAFDPEPDGNMLDQTVRIENVSENATFGFFVVNKNKYPNSPLYLEFSDTGEYEILLVSENEGGCRDTAMQKVMIRPDIRFFIPQAFSPNSDGLNDIWQCKGIGVRDFNLLVWNRWGEMIYRSEYMQQGWDGNMANTHEACPLGNYYYYVTIKDMNGKEYIYSGSILLTR